MCINAPIGPHHHTNSLKSLKGLSTAPTGILVVRNRSAAPDLFVTTPAYKPNTYSMDAVAVCLSSGDVLMMLLLCREPARMAMNCLPFTE